MSAKGHSWPGGPISGAVWGIFAAIPAEAEPDGRRNGYIAKKQVRVTLAGHPRAGSGRAMAEKTRYRTLVVDPPWLFRRQPRSVRPTYQLMDLEAIKRFPVPELADSSCHLYLWVPNAFVSEGLEVMNQWGFQYKTMVVWAKHQVGLGNYYRNATEPVLFGVKGRLPPLRRDVRTWFLADRRQHSRKPDEFYRIVESVSPAPRIDIFSREKRAGWDQLGNQCDFFQSKSTEAHHDGTSTVDVGRGGELLGCVETHDLRLDEPAAHSLPQGRPDAPL